MDKSGDPRYHPVSIPKRVSEALKLAGITGGAIALSFVSIPKRVSEALKQVLLLLLQYTCYKVSIPKRVSEALKLALDELDKANKASFNP